MKESTRRVIRTALQVLGGLCVLAPALVLEAGLDPAKLPWLGVALAVAAALARIMAMPQVNDLLRSVGLGTTDGKHEAGRPPADAGHARAWLLTGLGTLAAILLLAAATAPTAVSRPRTPAHVQVIAAYDCDGTLITVYGLERYRETSDGGEWVFQQDDGTVELQLHRIGDGAREGGQWTTYPTRSGGEGRRLLSVIGVPTWDAVRVVREGVASSQKLPIEGCPA